MSLLLAAVMTMHLTTSTFTPNAAVPQTMVARECGGENISPALRWSDAPKATKSFALLVHDPDAPVPGGFDHWVLYNIPATTNHVDAGAHVQAVSGINGTGKAGYFGPCPPPGKVHHYEFTLFALDVAHLESRATLDARGLHDEMAGHILAQATLTGTYKR